MAVINRKTHDIDDIAEVVNSMNCTEQKYENVAETEDEIGMFTKAPYKIAFQYAEKSVKKHTDMKTHMSSSTCLKYASRD